MVTTPKIRSLVIQLIVLIGDSTKIIMPLTLIPVEEKSLQTDRLLLGPKPSTPFWQLPQLLNSNSLSPNKTSTLANVRCFPTKMQPSTNVSSNWLLSSMVLPRLHTISVSSWTYRLLSLPIMCLPSNSWRSFKYKDVMEKPLVKLTS